VISRERLVKISEDIEEELKIGLKQGSQGTSSIAMLPSYVPALPTGKGKCLGYKLHTTLYNF
jgi:hexokinase